MNFKLMKKKSINYNPKTPMRKLIYHVATTLDNYISHEDGAVDGFMPEGDHVTDYLESLKTYDTVVMGRKTYEFGYAFGLKPGQRAYPHMKHYIFSKTLHFDHADEGVEVIDKDEAAFINQLKATEGTDIYLCGGGAFAGFLLEQALIDTLIIKLNPIIFGKGIPLFGSSTQAVGLTLQDTKVYKSGVVLLTYGLDYER
jgi:dihydrofolate reductase